VRSSRVAFASHNKIAVARRRRAEVQQIRPAKLVERAQQVMMVVQPASMFRDDDCMPNRNGLPHLLPRPT
jgi:hypothetical protein